MVKTTQQETSAEIMSSFDNTPLTDITWEQFEQEYLTREDQFKYEWVRGKVIKTERAMNQYQYYIIQNIQSLFNSLALNGEIEGELMVEIDTFFLPNSAHRRPDMAWFSDEQAAYMAHGKNQVPNFVIEIISKNDNADDLLDKLNDYAEAGVKVIWLISPVLKQVHVLANGSQSVCKGQQLCSAAPVLPKLQISVDNLFKKPALPA